MHLNNDASNLTQDVQARLTRSPGKLGQCALPGGVLRLVASSLCLQKSHYLEPSPRYTFLYLDTKRSSATVTYTYAASRMQADMVRLVEPTSAAPTFELARTTHMASFAFKAYGAPAKHYDLAAQDQDGSPCLYLDADFIWAHFQAGIRVTVRWTAGLDDLIAAVRTPSIAPCLSSLPSHAAGLHVCVVCARALWRQR